ncbi:MAG: DUF523 domain-containing protein [Candidatus Bathyarchaeota archaeon]|nr:DUF523 domain-containing protein [Candidatus Bathyarchaeota archaeon]MCX8177723.1 DUF523 domain-containing protein [Candidatus Bathyarchaeota archaeon]MDW8193984.1 DUF523 domain-containing protein [Nitrososphaerota archaeon]
MKLCSACLLGVKCRYDGGSSRNEKIIRLLEKEVLIPVCPEQLGGLPTPREPVELREGRAITKSGRDVTENFVRGAEQVLELAKLFGIEEAIMKQGSPSCGCGRIYDGTFSGKTIRGHGITAALLLENGIKVFSEEEV